MQTMGAFLVAALHAKQQGLHLSLWVVTTSCLVALVTWCWLAWCVYSLLSVALVSRLWTSKQTLGDVAL